MVIITRNCHGYYETFLSLNHISLKESEKHITPKVTRLFKMIAVLLPFLLIGILEFTLRLCNYGYDLSLFTEFPGDKRFLMFNPHASRKYFPTPDFAAVGNQELFKKKKENHTFRIFVLGESTTIGYPYFHNGSFHRWLLYRLMHSYPDKQFEIINLSLTAVNSYTVRGFAKELAKFQPDAVCIYCGQNEYYGALGIGSSQYIGSNPALVHFIISLRQLRTVQLLTNLYYKTYGLNTKGMKQDVNRMEMMADKQEIPFQSDLYYQGIHQFRVNMDATFRILQDQHIPVFISNLVSNIKDLPPFINDSTDYYESATLALSKQDYPLAETYFIQAKEHDKLRFRAPEALNNIIDSLCRIYPDVFLADTRSEFRNHSEGNLPGDNLFTDHVHPNLTGYYLMSNAFYNALQSSKLLPVTKNELTEKQLAEEMPVSVIDSLAGNLRIQNLKGHWPFNDKRYKTLTIPENNPEEIMAARLFRKEIGWLNAHNQLYIYYNRQNQVDKALSIAESSVLEYAEDPAFYEKAAIDNARIDRIEKAAFYMRKACMLAPEHQKAHYQQALNYINKKKNTNE